MWPFDKLCPEPRAVGIVERFQGCVGRMYLECCLDFELRTCHYVVDRAVYTLYISYGDGPAYCMTIGG